MRIGILFILFATTFVGPQVLANVMATPERAVASESDKQLEERAEKYLRSISARSADLLSESRENAEIQAQTVIRKGFEKVNRSLDTVGNQNVDSINLEAAIGFLRQFEPTVGAESRTKTISFLNRKFYRPTEREIVANLALPSYSRYSRWEKLHGVLVRCFPFSGTSCEWSELEAVCSSAIVPTSFVRIFKLKFLRNFVFETLNNLEPNSFVFASSDHVVTDYPLIARTIVLRN